MAHLEASNTKAPGWGPSYRLLLDDFHRTVVIAMTIVRVVQVAVDQVADVVSVRNGFVTAARPVHVIGRMTAANVSRSAAVGILSGYFNGVMLDGATVFLVVQMSIVQIVDVVAVLDGGVAAAFTVVVVVVIAVVIVSHERASPESQNVLRIDLRFRKDVPPPPENGAACKRLNIHAMNEG